MKRLLDYLIVGIVIFVATLLAAAVLSAAEPKTATIDVTVGGVELTAHVDHEVVEWRWLMLRVSPFAWIPVNPIDDGSRVRFSDGDLSEGTYAVILSASSPEGKISQAATTFTVGPAPEPGPEPEPKPDPQPAPLEHMTALVVLQSGEVAPSYAQALYGLRIQSWFSQNGHQLRITDPDSKDESGNAPVELVPYLGLPTYSAVFFDKTMTERGRGVYPQDEEAALRLLKKWGKEK